MHKLNFSLTGFMAVYVAFLTYGILQGYADLRLSFVFCVFALGFNAGASFAMFLNRKS